MTCNIEKKENDVLMDESEKNQVKNTDSQSIHTKSTISMETFKISTKTELENELSQELYQTIKDFFDLEDEKKIKYYFPELYGQRGYVIKGQEHAKGSKKGDLKEFYHIGDPTSNVSPENIWPIEINEFQEITSKAFLKLEEIGLQVLESTALYLDLEKNYFYDKVKGGQSIMRAIHYYPINPDDVSDGAVRAVPVAGSVPKLPLYRRGTATPRASFWL